VPGWLTTDTLLSQFSERRTPARRLYRVFVSKGGTQQSIWAGLRQQIYLGDENFVRRMQQKAAIQGDRLSVPKVQRRAPAPSLKRIAESHPERNDAIIAAYETGAYSYREIAEYHGLHLATVGRIVRRHMLQCSH
jgi:DNA-directed RNA polymerase specialized sigma24 family protein